MTTNPVVPRKHKMLNSVQQEVEWRRIKADPAYFFEHYWHVPERKRDKSNQDDADAADKDLKDRQKKRKRKKRRRLGNEEGKTKFTLFDYQRETLDVLLTEYQVMVLKARQIGFTTLLAAYLYWVAITHQNALCIIISRRQIDAKDVVRNIRNIGYAHLPGWLKQKCDVTNNSTENITFANNSIIESMAGGDDPARGRAATVLVLDEWPKYKNAEQAWAAAEPATEGGQLIALGTGNGAGTFYHEQWLEARAGKSDYYPMFWPWHARPDRDQEWFENICRSKRPHLRAQEYPSDEHEAFHKAGENVFPGHLIDELEEHEAAPEVGAIVKEDYGYKFRPYSAVVQPDDRLMLWTPPKVLTKYSIGVDPAGGQQSGDYSSVTVTDEEYNVVACWHGWISPVELADILVALGHYYNRALIVVEANSGWGDSVCDALMKADYPNVFHSKRWGKGMERERDAPGLAVTAKTKQALVSTLFKALADRILVVPDKETVIELRIYQLLNSEKGTMGAPPNRHDDRVSSLMLSVYGLQHAHKGAPTIETRDASPLWGTMEWWLHNIVEEEEYNKNRSVRKFDYPKGKNFLDVMVK